MPYAIARIAKLKQSNLGGSGMHTSRQRNTPNADLEKQNIRIIDSYNSDKNLNQLVLDKIAQHPQQRKIRPDAVYCVEFLLTASPQYFRPDNPTLGGYYQQDRLEAWTDASKQWLQKEYDNQIVRAELHLDEMTPHIHAYFVPLDKNGQLRCHHFFDGRYKLQKFQDSYCNAVKHLGLERGIKGSLSGHLDIKHFYRIVEEGKDLEINSLNQSQITNKAADRDRAVKQKQEMEATAQRLALENQQLQKQALLLQIQNQKLQAQLEKEKEKEKEKDLPLDSVARHLGLSENKSNGTWEGHNHTITINGSNFHDSNQNQNSGSINLVMQVNNCKLNQALTWLEDRFGKEGMVRSFKANANIIAAAIAQTSPVQEWKPPQPASSNWEPVKDYLIKHHRLNEKFVTQLHQKQWVYADQQQNAVFLMRKLPQANSDQIITGAIVQNISSEKSLLYTKGTHRGIGYFYFNVQTQASDEIKKVVLCQSPINALAHATMQKKFTKSVTNSSTMYLTIDSPQSLPLDFLQKIPQVSADHNLEMEMGPQIKQLLPQIQFIHPSHYLEQELSNPKNEKRLNHNKSNLDFEFE